MLVTAAAWAVMALVAMLDRLAFPALRGETAGFAPEDAPPVTVLIPARNEERNIEGCVLSVLNQTYPNVKAIVIDDQSTDATPAILEAVAARDPRLRVIHGQPLPDGWVGKGWALWQGHQQAEADWLLLLDADVRLEPWAVDQMIREALERGADLLNPWPRFVNIGFWERLLQPMLWGLVRLRFPLIWVNQPWAPENMAFGPVMMIRKSVYDAIGGHKPVAMDILEDVALSKYLRARGYKTIVLNGKHIARVRMYHSLREIVDGWTKTAYGAMAYNFPLMIVAILGLFWVSTQPFVTLAWSLANADTGLMAIAGFQILALGWRRLQDARDNDFPLWTLLLHPLAIVLVHWMQVRALWKYYFGSYEWKGRSYRKPKPAQTAVGGD